LIVEYLTPSNVQSLIFNFQCLTFKLAQQHIS
jgi:hypothetical protein